MPAIGSTQAATSLRDVCAQFWAEAAHRHGVGLSERQAELRSPPGKLALLAPTLQMRKVQREVRLFMLKVPCLLSGRHKI